MLMKLSLCKETSYSLVEQVVQLYQFMVLLRKLLWRRYLKLQVLAINRSIYLSIVRD